MNEYPINSHSKQRQGGAALAISLILLIVITLLSLSAMRSANLNTRIAVNHQHKLFAFQAAENALSMLLDASVSELKTLKIPGKEDDVPEVNEDMFDVAAVAGSVGVSADLEMDLIEVSPPGKYKFSGYGMNVISIKFQADSVGKVEGSKSTAHNRMEVILVRN